MIVSSGFFSIKHKFWAGMKQVYISHCNNEIEQSLPAVCISIVFFRFAKKKRSPYFFPVRIRQLAPKTLLGCNNTSDYRYSVTMPKVSAKVFSLSQKFQYFLDIGIFTLKLVKS